MIRSAAPRLAFLSCLALSACGGGSGGGSAPADQNGSNRARFTFSVDLQGSPGTLILDVEVVGNSGITWGPGVNPDITGVISTGSSTIFTAGELRSDTALYVFTGENQFADFTDTATFERFRVQWAESPQGLTMIVDPFGPGPTIHECVLVQSQLL